MLIRRRSVLTGVVRELDVPVTESELCRWQGGVPIQKAMPTLSVEYREFLLSGAWGGEWEQLFPPPEDQEDH